MKNIRKITLIGCAVFLSIPAVFASTSCPTSTFSGKLAYSERGTDIGDTHNTNETGKCKLEIFPQTSLKKPLREFKLDCSGANMSGYSGYITKNCKFTDGHSGIKLSGALQKNNSDSFSLRLYLSDEDYDENWTGILQTISNNEQKEFLLQNWDLLIVPDVSDQAFNNFWNEI